MSDTLILPPPYRLVPISHCGAFDHARALARAGAEDGTLVWSQDRRLFDCAVVLEQEPELDAMPPILGAGLLALGDAVATAAPPNAELAIGGPDRLLVNGAPVGGVRLAVETGRLVLGGSVDVLGDPDDDAPGRHPERTALREEGFGDVDTAALVNGFSRHLLLWIDRWLEDGAEKTVLRAVRERRRAVR